MPPWAMVMLLCFIRIFAGLSMRIRYNDLNWLVEELAGAKEEQQCNILEQHSANFEDQETLFEFVIDTFRAAVDKKIDDVLILRCLSDRLKKNLGIIETWDDELNETLLFTAVRSNLPKSVEYLIDSGMPLGVENAHHHTAAMSALGRCPRCVTLLLENGVNANEKLLKFCREREGLEDLCQDGWSLVHFAVSRNDPESLNILSQHNADLNAQDTLGFSPVHIAVIYDMPNMLLELGKLHVSFNIPANDGRTPAHLVCKYHEEPDRNITKYFEILHQFGGRLDARNGKNETPAHICARKNPEDKTSPKALGFLYNVAPNSFNILDANNQKPEDIAQKENNEAQLFFANLRAQEKTKEVEQLLNEKSDLRKEEERVTEKCQELMNQSDKLFDCTNHTIDIPRGVMLTNKTICNGKEPCAARCPNDFACPRRNFSDKLQCAEGYDEDSVGCTRCASGRGRDRQDPFQCKPCGGPLWLSWVGYIGKALGIYGLSLWTAQKVERDQLASVLKIWMAFGVVVASISPSIRSSDTFSDAHAALMFAERTGEGVGSLGSQMAGPSFDCLLSVTDASISQWLLLSFAPPLVLWFLSMIYMMWRSFRTEAARMEISQVMKDALKVSIVVTNCFLPDMVAALVRFFPCIHFQTGAASPKFLQFQLETECDKVVWTRLGSVLAASILGIVLGPLYWVTVIKQSVQWKDRKEVLGFLTSGYQEYVIWWEATVLIRKCVIAVATTLFTVSYAPMLYLSSLLFVVGVSLAGHAYVLPYKDNLLNKVELGTLLAAFVAIFCTFLLKLESFDWSVDHTVTIPAAVVLMVALTLPALGLMGLYFSEMRLAGRLESFALPSAPNSLS